MSAQNIPAVRKMYKVQVFVSRWQASPAVDTVLMHFLYVLLEIEPEAEAC